MHHGLFFSLIKTLSHVEAISSEHAVAAQHQ